MRTVVRTGVLLLLLGASLAATLGPARGEEVGRGRRHVHQEGGSRPSDPIFYDAIDRLIERVHSRAKAEPQGGVQRLHIVSNKNVVRFAKAGATLKRFKREQQDMRKVRAAYEQSEKSQNAAQEQEQKSQDALEVQFAFGRPARGNVVARQLAASERFAYAFWLKPTGKENTWSSVFHKGAHNDDRAPGVWLHPSSTRLHIRADSKRQRNDGCDPTEELQLDQWTHVAFFFADRVFKVYLNGKLACENINMGALVLNEGPLYVSDPWYPAAQAVVADLRYIDLSQVRVGNSVVARQSNDDDSDLRALLARVRDWVASKSYQMYEQQQPQSQPKA